MERTRFVSEIQYMGPGEIDKKIVLLPENFEGRNGQFLVVEVVGVVNADELANLGMLFEEPSP